MGSGWLALLGGGEFSFGETLAADRAWLEKTPPGPVGFVPAASGSSDYARLFASYLRALGRPEVELIPVYRPRDGRRARNADRILGCAAVYLGGGVSDHLLDALAGTPVAAALEQQVRRGGVAVAIGSSAQACGTACRSLLCRGQVREALGLFPGVLEPAFEPTHDRRLRRLLAESRAPEAWGIPEGGALLLGSQGEIETVGPVFRLRDADGDLEPVERPRTVEAPEIP